MGNSFFGDGNRPTLPQFRELKREGDTGKREYLHFGCKASKANSFGFLIAGTSVRPGGGRPDTDKTKYPLCLKGVLNEFLMIGDAYFPNRPK